MESRQSWTINHRIKTAEYNHSWVLPGVRRMTDMVMREQTTRMTSRAMAIPFQFLCGGLTPPRSCKKRGTKDMEVSSLSLYTYIVCLLWSKLADELVDLLHLPLVWLHTGKMPKCFNKSHVGPAILFTGQKSQQSIPLSFSHSQNFFNSLWFLCGFF